MKSTTRPTARPTLSAAFAASVQPIPTSYTSAPATITRRTLAAIGLGAFEADGRPRDRSPSDEGWDR